MKKTIRLNEAQLYQLVEEVLLEYVGYRKPIPGFKWDYSNENMYTLVSLRPFEETNLDITLEPLVDYFIGVMYNKIHHTKSRSTNKDAAIIILFPKENIKISIRFFFSYDVDFKYNGRNRTLSNVKNVQIRNGGVDFGVYKNGILNFKLFDRQKREWLNTLIELVKENLGRLEQ